MTLTTKKVTLVKLGGAVITNKEIPNQLRPEVLDRLVREIARAYKEQPDMCLVLGNGVGSYAHVPAAHYQTMNGFINDESRIGMAITQDSAAQINREVVKACLRHEIPAVTVAPSNSLLTRDRKASSYFTDVFEEYMRLGLLPVTYGDVIVDQAQGCTIWSTDKVLAFFAQEFTKNGWEVESIIHVTEAAGVWQMQNGEWLLNDDGSKRIYDSINPSMRDEVKQSMSSIKGFDVTGGMWHKIEESLALTEIGITTRIVSGLQKDSLYNALLQVSDSGTVITR
ncbi:MAG: isopentenyl phosphate kinase [bacterium]|nr:isopentenyl phosphate kinase [bacterium]